MPTATMQPKARHLVLSEIKKTGDLTVRQLASNLGITTVAVRKQLAILEQEGLVRGRQVKIPRGRPASTYELTARARDLFPQTYNQVLIDILEDLRDLDGDEKVKLLLDKRNERLLERYGRADRRQTTRRKGARVGQCPGRRWLHGPRLKWRAISSSSPSTTARSMRWPPGFLRLAVASTISFGNCFRPKSHAK